MEVDWKVDEVTHNEAWKHIGSITKEISSTAGKAETILDLGGGSGWFGLHLASSHPGAVVISVDLRPRPAQNVEHIKASVLDVPLMSEIADIIGANAILHHVPDNLDDFAAEAYRLLKHSGILVMQEPLAGNPPADWSRKLVRTRAHEEGERPLPWKAMESALERNGFVIEKFEFFFITSYLVPHIIPILPERLRGPFRKLGLFLVKLDENLLVKLPGLTRWAAYVCVVAKKR